MTVMKSDAVKWEGQVVNGLFPLRRYLGGCDHSAVFLTESPVEGFLNAAIKIVPARANSAAAQIAYWRAAIALPHPHLLRLLEAGSWQLDGGSFLFVVMEYAEETLAQVLPIRALTADEVREMLVPTLELLGSLHANRLVHGQLRPTNFLVVNDQLKLSSDTIRPAGSSAAIERAPSVYDAPEVELGGAFAAGDVWGLGVTLIEALTQHAPARREDISACLASLNVPPPLSDIIRRCLSTNPADRPSVSDLDAQLKPRREPPAELTPRTAPVQTMRNEPELSAMAPPAGNAMRQVARIVLGLLIVLVCGWVAVRLLMGRNGVPSAPPGVPGSPPTLDIRPQSAAPLPEALVTKPASNSPAPEPASRPAAPASPDAVVHEEIPLVSRGSRDTIRGQIKVPVRVTVDSEGRVIHAALERVGTSRYFDRIAAAAALKWTFVPAATQPLRHWRLRFEFTREGTNTRAEPVQQ